MALGFSAVIIRERRRFKSVKNKDREPLDEKKHAADYDKLKNDILLAHLHWKGDDFFRAVEALDGELKRDGGASKEAMECLRRVKERLYSARFGGGTVTAEQMSESVSELKGAGLL
jgi:FMN phosphatase YigB (HAD superfamily)